ncbi:hypothetical protein [Eubacterium xylanophilum]|uniref:hypothetical protein n=1 Tax=Eubacterium xylanophilum TaxID=39497 RepID=UPI00047E21C4|nr:hypothetical protein [Eubacterium xylanophilum]
MEIWKGARGAPFSHAIGWMGIACKIPDLIDRREGHAYLKKKDLACPESGKDLIDKELGACLFEKEGFGMPREGDRLD